jgi:PAS domain S-box-containing protein
VCAPSLDHTFVSPSARTVIGHAPAELLGRSLSAIIHPEDWPGVARVLAKHAHEPSGTAGELLCEYRARHRDGRWVWLETRGRTVSGPDGPGGLILSTRDVTKRRELEASMLQAQKLESLGLLAGGVAHDFNNILMAIMGNAEVSAHALPPSSPLHEHLTTIVSSSERAADLCKQMMTYAGRSGSTLTRVQLNDVLRDIHALVGAAVPAKARLGYALGEVLPPIDADPAQLRQIAMNLVINAAEAIGDRGGDVRIASGTLAFETPFDVGPQENHLQLFAARPQGQHVYLRISDDGSGMDQATLERIFDPFFTTKFTGRGLGLSAVVGIVYHHRGFIRVTTQPGHGTTFTVAFPVAVRAAVPEPAVAPAPVRAAWRGAGLCLVVDDDGDVLDITREMLTSMGFSVITATDGAYALDVFRRRSREVAFVICDVAMPRMDGGELVQALRAIRPDVTIAIMTGFAEADMRERFAPLQVARVIQKPFSYDELLKAARALLAAAGGAGGSDAADPTDAASGAPASGTIGRPNAPN